VTKEENSEGRFRMVWSNARDWHLLFGVTLSDLFIGTPWDVELEKELTLGSRQLDVAIIQKTEVSAESEGRSSVVFPDGLEGLRRHNLLTFKSHQEALDGWAINELRGHYVEYRKGILKNSWTMFPESDFALYAVYVRFPRKLSRQLSLHPAGQRGVFDIPWTPCHIRVIVIEAVEEHPRNAVWE